MKFKLIEDWYIEDFFDKIKIYESGHIFTKNDNNKYLINSKESKLEMTFDEMFKSNRFEVINDQEIEIIVEELPIDLDNEIKSWRIQLDVKTSLSNLKLIQKFIYENIPSMI